MAVVKRSHTALGAAIICILLSACATTSIARNSGALTAGNTSAVEAIVDAQLAADNRRDLEGFLSYYSDDAKLFDYPNQLIGSGKDPLRVTYERSFRNPNIRALIVKRIVLGRFVIDHERIAGLPDGALEAIAVY
jgi:hypothetical protein